MRQFSSSMLFVRNIVTLLVVAVIVIFILLVAGTGIASCVMKPTSPPTVEEAPWAIQTESRVYFASKYSVVEGVPTITGYWKIDGKGRYIFLEGVKTFPPSRETGKIGVIRR